MNTTKMDKKINRLRFCVSVRRDLIDGSERAIEHHKSMIRNYKEQIKTMNREIGAILSPAIKIGTPWKNDEDKL